ncbi:MAG: ATP-binding protein [Actinomycetes bacterium]
MCDASIRVERELPESRQAPALARAFLRESSCGAHSAAVVDEAVLLVSEVVTNSVLHGGPPITVAVDCDGGALQVLVRDGSPRLLQRRQANEDDEGGRGLELVDLLSSEWGVEPEAPDGKHVWFRLG